MRSDDIRFQRSGQTHIFPDLFHESIIAGIVVDLLINTLRPVVTGHILISLDYITIDIEFSPYMLHGLPNVGRTVRPMAILGSAYTKRSYTIAHRTVFRGSRSRFIVVVDNIHLHAFTAITTIARPVVNHVIPHIHILASLRERTRAKTRRTAFVMRQQIMMKRSPRSSPDGTIAMTPLGMSCRTEAFGRDAPLYGQVFSPINGTALIYRPTDGAMINHHIPAIGTSQAIRLAPSFIAYPETEIADNHIIGIDCHRIACDADALSRSRLTGNSQITLCNPQVAVEKDSACHVKNNSTCTLL